MQFLADMESNPLLRDSVECQRLVMEAMKYHLLPERRPLLQSPRTRPRKATVGALFAVGGATSIEQYCLRRDTWRQVAVMSGRRLQFGVAVLDDRLYVVGGRDGLKTLNTVECYNPRSKSWSPIYMPLEVQRCHGLLKYKCNVWTAVAPMSLSRDAVGVCLLGDRLYAVGGYDGQVYLNTVEAYDPQTNEWTQVNT
uniref:Uncharacterized protein n=1 Tax=Sinocyclocheilus grahami TaxID=75366 RepID=A0A672RMS2_SINGR